MAEVQLAKNRAKIAELRRKCRQIEEGHVLDTAVAYGEAHSLEHRRVKDENNRLFPKLLRDHGVAERPVLVIDDDLHPPLGTTRAVLAAIPDTPRVVCVNYDATKCENMRRLCGDSKVVSVVCADALKYVTSSNSSDLSNFGGFYFDLCGHVDLSVRALLAVRARRPEGSYIIGITYTTARDADNQLIAQKLRDATIGYKTLGGESFLPSQMHTHFYWVEPKK